MGVRRNKEYEGRKERGGMRGNGGKDGKRSRETEEGEIQ